MVPAVWLPMFLSNSAEDAHTWDHPEKAQKRSQCFRGETLINGFALTVPQAKTRTMGLMATVFLQGGPYPTLHPDGLFCLCPLNI